MADERFRSGAWDETRGTRSTASAFRSPRMCHGFVTPLLGTDQHQEEATGQTRWSERYGGRGRMSVDTG